MAVVKVAVAKAAAAKAAAARAVAAQVVAATEGDGPYADALLCTVPGSAALRALYSVLRVMVCAAQPDVHATCCTAMCETCCTDSANSIPLLQLHFAQLRPACRAVDAACVAL